MATVTNDFETLPLPHFTEKAYLDYSMYVILDRALPHLGDGLKPVQRRIIYAMSELGLSAGAKYKKSARTVGDVLGKFHPHGDSACYEAMVLMSQSFAYRYPLIDGQGNWGSPDDPKSFAAMRYTESRLAPYADVLLAELGMGTTDWRPNFDGTLDEPVLLPARLPNVLLNPTIGIAVGMATDIPPHNLREVANACIHLLDHPKATITELMTFIQGPDYPTAGEIITAKEDIAALYKTGNGSIRQRAVYQMEDGNVIVTALPYQVSGSKILEQIAEQMQAKKLPLIEDLRDESDHENPTRLVIVPRSNRVDIEAVMAHLFATTDLEKSYRVNLNMIGLNGRPQVKDLAQILTEWLEYRKATVIKRLSHRLQQIDDRLHILTGLLIAYLNLDEIIRIIRTEDDPKTIFMTRYKLSEIQAHAILETKLRHLAKLEEIKIQNEQKALQNEKNELESILQSPTKLKSLIKNELKEDAKRYGDDRRSPIVVRQVAQAFTETDVLPSEPITLVLSENGWIRAAKGHEIDAQNLSYKSGDQFFMAAYGKNNEPAIFIDSTGRSYQLATHTLPSARGQGDPLTGRLTPPPGANFVGVAIGSASDDYLMASTAGYGFICKLEDLYSKNKSGKTVLTVPEGQRALTLRKIQNVESDYIAAVTNLGQLLIFPVKDLPRLVRGKGNKIISLPAKNPDEILVDVVTLTPNQSLVIYAGKKPVTLKMKDLQHYISERAKRGSKLPRGISRVEKIAVVD